MSTARDAHAACVLRGKIYVIGGLDTDGKVVYEIECYDPVNDAWIIVGNAIDISYLLTLVAYCLITNYCACCTDLL